MVAAFLDTSCCVRRYVRSEPGAARVRSVCRLPGQNAILLAGVTLIEVASALARKTREGAIQTTERDHLWRLFERHWRTQYQIIKMNSTVYTKAQQLMFRHPLRAYDALQLASALTAQAALQHTALQFWTADRRQASAAEAEGLTVEFLS
ncbi:MAG TPA: type II toxin-antitoxin system VapC family toxin [Chloroflexota bacterium]|nr:type II toxin-antitoxin system VapC family toxin [Chloroflexota bacterium]